MKSRIDKTLKLIETKKQMTLGKPVNVIERQQKKKPTQKRPSYWVCDNHHVFKHNFRVEKKNMRRDLRCPQCNAPARNKVNENTYLEYLCQKGRADMKTYREKKEKAEQHRNK